MGHETPPNDRSSIPEQFLSVDATHQVADLILCGVLRAGDVLTGKRGHAEQTCLSRPKTREDRRQTNGTNPLNNV